MSEKSHPVCKHCLGAEFNEIGETKVFCEIWDSWRNLTLGECFGNCESEEYDESPKEESNVLTVLRSG